MQPKPVRTTRLPAYPTKLEVRADADLLSRNLPPGWRNAPGMAGALGIFLAAGLSSCAGKAPDDAGGDSATASGPATIQVAPIFEHGDGRGATGCIVISPPVFLSEEEALQVIREELEKGGLAVRADADMLPSVRVPIIAFTSDGESLADGEKPLDADLGAPDQGVAVEFVSSADYTRLRTRKGFYSTVSGYDTKEVASDIAAAVAEQGDAAYFGTFYDPLPSSRETTPEEAQELLRLQVRDFVAWLEGQGAI